MKTIRRSLTVLLLTVGAAACGTSSILAPDTDPVPDPNCTDPEICIYQPGTGSYQPGTGSYQPGTGSYQPGTGS